MKYKDNVEDKFPDALKDYYNSRKYLMNFYYNMAIISLIDKLCMENQCYPNLYNNIIEIFDYIDQQKMNIEIMQGLLMVQKYLLNLKLHIVIKKGNQKSLQ